MSSTRLRLIENLDRLTGLALVALLLGPALAFGGVAWWSRPALALGATALALVWVARTVLLGRWPILRSPALALGGLAIALGVVQLVPLPPGVAGLAAHRAMMTNALGVIPDRVLHDDPSFAMPAEVGVRSPLSLDRPATLRWTVSALIALAVFWVATHFADRLQHVRLIWGCVVAAFFVNVVLAAVQFAGGVNGLYGQIAPGGAGPIWAPSPDDLLAAPVPSVLRVVGERKPDRPTLAAVRPLPMFQFGSMVGGPGAFLALASLALPLAVGLLLQALAPRGGRDGLLLRLRVNGRGSEVVLTLLLIVAGTVLVGMMAGKRASVPFALALLVVGLLGSWSTGLRRVGVALTLALGLALGAGILVGEHTTPEVVPRVSWLLSSSTWRESWAILRDFPLAGTGLGTFATVHPFYKGGDIAPNSAMSSLGQWAVESGALGLALLGALGLWAVIRLPGAIRRVGTADRALCAGLLGALVGFGVFSAIHWTVQLPAVALAVAAVAGTANRWLAGATDLFVEQA